MVGSISWDSIGIRPGDTLEGKYRVDEILGVGGMGIVVGARHIRLDEKVAIKLVPPAALGNPEAVLRFEREARAAVKIKSEHVVHVMDVGTLENGTSYMVMEYLEGRDLAAWLRESGPFHVAQAVELTLQACEAIADAHALGIIHRDLKPANLFCIRGSDGLLSIKVLDFGISKVTGLQGTAADVHMTRTSAVMGSPLYMSPEQMQSSREVDTRTDIWSIGVVLYELLSGRVPFGGNTLPEVCINVVTQPSPPLRTATLDIPAGLERVILRCLEKDREKRYANIAELALALAPFGPDRARLSVDRISRVIQTTARSAGPPVRTLPRDCEQRGPQGTVPAWGQTTPTSSRGSTGKLVTLAATAAAALALATGVVVRRCAPPQIGDAMAPSVGAAASIELPWKPPVSSASAPSLVAAVRSAAPPSASSSATTVQSAPPASESLATAPLPATSVTAKQASPPQSSAMGIAPGPRPPRPPPRRPNESLYDER